MGGRVAMRLALLYQNRVEKLIVADMSMRPPKLRPEHWMIFQTMKEAPIENMKSYKEIELFLSKHINSQRLVLFILKNIKKTKSGYEWKLNFKSLMSSFEKEIGPLATDEVFDNPALFIRGGKSDYILEEDFDKINEHFPLTIMETIEGAGHWLHAEKPMEFMHLVESFL
jgi:pimeloyl-ACP methyl ester carboxylesterase